MLVKRICFLALLSTFLIVVKVALQSLPYVELVTLFFVVYGMTLSIKENWLVFICFFIVNIAINGYGHYWLPYFIIFPLTFTLSHSFKDFKHRYLISSIIAINCGFIIFCSYFIYDWIIFDATYAVAAGTTAFWFNFLEGMINAVAVFIIGIPLIKIINYGKERLFHEKVNLSRFSNKLTKVKLVIIGSSMVVFLSAFSIIPIYLYGLHSSKIDYNIHNVAKSKSNYSVSSNNCKLVMINKLSNNEISIIKDCLKYKTLGEVLNSFDTDVWEINYIESYATDFNFDGKDERFIGSINKKNNSFNTNNLCPTIYINETPSPHGVDILEVNNGFYYKFIFRENQC